MMNLSSLPSPPVSLPQGENSRLTQLRRLFGVLFMGVLVFMFVKTVEQSHPITGLSGVVIKNGGDKNQSKSYEMKDALPLSMSSSTSANVKPTRRVYNSRGRYSLLADSNMTLTKIRNELIEEWGSWTLIDDRERPTDDFYATYPHRDVPREKFPPNAWQIDTQYLAKFLPESLRLVERAQKAIESEYGGNSSMFTVYKYDSTADDDVKNKGAHQGGWTTNDSWQALVKRILHAIMTEDLFVFAMGGHSAAAGHGNHFQQSYTLQVQWILEAVFARMGVQHVARNFGNGGLGTIHNGLAASDIYGHDIDMLMWDSGMTEKSNRDIEVMHRQALLSSKHKIPILWTLATKQAIEFYNQAKVPFGIPGNGHDGLRTASTYEELMMQPYAARYMKCEDAAKSICKNIKYDAVCWVDRQDVTPEVAQKSHPDGRAGWHPGLRDHQIQGRVLAYTILSAIRDALNLWNSAENFVLDDHTWHVSDDFEQTRQAVTNMNLTATHCLEFKNLGMEFVCHYPLKARTEFTPRAFPSLSNIRTLMHPEMRAFVNEAESNFYEPPDVFNPSLHPPEGEVDVLSIVELGVPFAPILGPRYSLEEYKMPNFGKSPIAPVGRGTLLDTASGDYGCDGSVDSWCKRGKKESCLLRAHNDGRNGLLFDGFSGWIVMTIPDLLHGQIMVKFESWHSSGENWRTDSWIRENNVTQDERTLTGRKLDTSIGLDHSIRFSNDTASSRQLKKKKPPELCELFLFEYAINGKVSSLDRDGFKEMRMGVARVVETLVLLDDPEFTGGVETEVEVAVRIVGCERHNTFKLTHIYWT